MRPSIGRIVIYKTTAEDRLQMTQDTFSVVPRSHLPAMISYVHESGEKPLVNLKVALDGCGELWKTSIAQGNEEGQWMWPVISK